jgi:hypothetical protein
VTPTQVIVEADGGSRGNPGPAGYGAVVFDSTRSVLAERKESIGIATNNVAEYRGSPALRDGSPPPASRHECCCYVTDRPRCRSIAATPDAAILSSRNWAARRPPARLHASGTAAVSTPSSAHPSAEPVRRQRHRPACSVFPSSSTKV